MKTKFAAFLMTAGFALAQGPGFGPPSGGQAMPPTDLVKTYLTLNDGQIQSMRNLLQQQQTANQQTLTSINQKQQQLDTLLRQGSTDALALGKLLVDMQALRKQLDQSGANLRTQIRNQLTTDQKTKLKVLSDAAALEPAIGQARGLGLIDPPAQTPGGQGPGIGPRGFGRGPGMMMGGPRRMPPLAPQD